MLSAIPVSASDQLTLLQALALALVQGITEFLPISSSAHLLFPQLLLSWPDQGIAFDIALHVATLLAVMVFTRRELGDMLKGLLLSVRQRQLNPQARLALLLALATVPAGLAGLLLKDWIEGSMRVIPVIASTSIIFALLLALADRRGGSSDGPELSDLSIPHALLIGCAQMLAIIPGTSRSGVTMTAALLLGWGRVDAARISFLLAIPIIAASGLLAGLELLSGSANSGASEGTVATLALAMPVAACSALVSMQLLIRFVNRIGYTPFVIYRLLLGLLLFALWLS